MKTEQHNYNMGNTILSAMIERGIVKKFTVYTCWAYDDWEIPFEVAIKGNEDYSTTYTPKEILTFAEFEYMFLKPHGYVSE
jgi:hypothetical protein